MASLLDLDPDLGAGLSPEAVRAARPALRVQTIELEGPVWDTGELEPATGPSWLGLLVVDGLLVRCVSLGNRTACELIGPGDLIRPWDLDAEYDPLRPVVSWRIPGLARCAVLDGRFTARAGACPPVLGALIGRAATRARALTLHHAVSQLGRTDARLLVLFWVLAERWGSVGPDGIRIRLPLTHEILAMLVAVRRPSVTLSLQRLDRAGLIHREARDRWRLSPAAIDHLEEPEKLVLAGRDAVPEEEQGGEDCCEETEAAA